MRLKLPKVNFIFYEYKQIFCSDLDKIESALPKDDGGDYELMFKEGPFKT
jgi:hypothetical protein